MLPRTKFQIYISQRVVNHCLWCTCAPYEKVSVQLFCRKRNYTCLSFCSRGGLPPLLGRHPPPTDTPGQTPLPSTCWDTHPLHSACWDTVNKRAVGILMDCILVFHATMFCVSLIRESCTAKIHAQYTKYYLLLIWLLPKYSSNCEVLVPHAYKYTPTR